MIRLFQSLVFALFLSLPMFAAESKTILVLGDSIAAGYGLDLEEAFPALLQEKIDKSGLNFKVVNAGLSGDTTAGGLRRISWLLRQNVDVLLLELGGNDGLRGIDPDETGKNLRGIIAKVKEKNPKALIVIAGMQMPENMGKDYTTRFRDVFPSVARESNATLIPFFLEGVGGKADLNQPDRIHPTDEGHRIIAATIWKVLQPVLTGTGNESIRESASR
jgi:acyl-CoA thioesterase-1